MKHFPFLLTKGFGSVSASKIALSLLEQYTIFMAKKLFAIDVAPSDPGKPVLLAYVYEAYSWLQPG